MTIQPLTDKELEAFFQVYREAFPEWKVKHGVVLTRSLGPISQHIPFENLSYGAYRPACSVWVAGPPKGSGILYQLLDVKHREVRRREHESKWPLVLRAMEDQFVPNLRQPLDLAEIVRLAEQEVERDRIENIRVFNGLATLNVHLELSNLAVVWCDRAEASFASLGRQPAAWEAEQVAFARELRNAIQSGQGKELLSADSD